MFRNIVLLQQNGFFLTVLQQDASLCLYAGIKIATIAVFFL